MPAPGPYSYRVRAFDAAGNLSDLSNTASATMPGHDANPTAPGNLDGDRQRSARVDLAWEESTDDLGVTGYKVYRTAR